jgi:hypothetical protein
MNRKYNTKTDSASLNVDDTPRWYSVHVHSGFELSVVRNIKQAIADAVGDMASNFIDYFPKVSPKQPKLQLILLPRCVLIFLDIFLLR